MALPKSKPKPKPKLEPKLQAVQECVASAAAQVTPTDVVVETPEAGRALETDTASALQSIAQPEPISATDPDRGTAEAQPEKRSAMKLPPGLVPRAGQGPQLRHGWNRSAGGRPQRDAERRAGKSRKVH